MVILLPYLLMLMWAVLCGLLIFEMIEYSKFFLKNSSKLVYKILPLNPFIIMYCKSHIKAVYLLQDSAGEGQSLHPGTQE